jgi:hypothetical protein
LTKEKPLKIRSAECLVLVAIVASAAAVRVREHLADPAVQRHASLKGPSAACDDAHDGVLPARCDTAQGIHDERDIEDPRAMSRPPASRHARPHNLWV